MRRCALILSTLGSSKSIPKQEQISLNIKINGGQYDPHQVERIFADRNCIKEINEMSALCELLSREFVSGGRRRGAGI